MTLFRRGSLHRSNMFRIFRLWCRKRNEKIVLSKVRAKSVLFIEKYDSRYLYSLVFQTSSWERVDSDKHLPAANPAHAIRISMRL